VLSSELDPPQPESATTAAMTEVCSARLTGAPYDPQRFPSTDLPSVANASLRRVNARAWIVTVVPLAGLAVFIVLFPRGGGTFVSVAGAGMAAAGFALVTVARLQLGSSFSVAPKATALVERGLYSRIRHPVYVFSTLGITGLILYVGELRLLPLVAVIVVIQIVRARREERVLEEEFGERYRRYRERTWF